MRILLNTICSAALLLSLHLPVLASTSLPSDTATDADAIRTVINTSYDTPGHKVSIDPVVISGDYAIASWLHIDKGGRALLHRSDGHTWEIMLCAGKALQDRQFLIQAGVNEADAGTLTRQLAAAESALPATTTNLFDQFNTVVMGAHYQQHH